MTKQEQMSVPAGDGAELHILLYPLVDIGQTSGDSIAIRCCRSPQLPRLWVLMGA